MSKENIEVVRAAYEAWNRGDMNTLRELYRPDVMIITSIEGWPEPPPTVGREAVMQQWERQRDAWDIDRVEPISDFVAGGDRVIVRFVWRTAGHGPNVDMEITGVYTVRKGKILLIEFFRNHADALEAVRLAEQGAPPDAAA
jgi:ketosteroid isomerase-like protein